MFICAGHCALVGYEAFWAVSYSYMTHGITFLHVHIEKVQQRTTLSVYILKEITR